MGFANSISGDVMTQRYGPAERLREQLEILLHEPDATDIVVASTLGESAVPILTGWLDGERLSGSRIDAAVRILGMISAPAAIPTLAHLLSKTGDRSFVRESPDQRAVVNALRKIGNDEALATLVANVERLDLGHARSAFGAFGDRARKALLAAAAKEPAAARVLVLAKEKEVIPHLVKRVDSAGGSERLEALELLAAFGSDAPKDWAVQRLKGMQNEVALAYLAIQRRGRRDLLAEHDALLTILYHANDASVLAELGGLLPVEESSGLLDNYRLQEPSVTLLALCWGNRARPALEALAADSPPTVQNAAKKLLQKIPVREPYQSAFQLHSEITQGKTDDDFFGKRHEEEAYDDDE